MDLQSIPERVSKFTVKTAFAPLVFISAAIVYDKARRLWDNA